MRPLISHLTSREILDSRGDPTVECTCNLTDGISATAAVPSGASTGTFEAFELRDQDSNRYNGKGVLQAVDHLISVLSPAVAGDDPTLQSKCDQQLLAADGTKNKSRLGANAILAASEAIAKTGALAKHVPLFQHLADLSGNDQVLTIPTPFFNILNGGKHANMNLDFQEFIIVPNAGSIPTFSKQLQIGVQVTQSLKQILNDSHLTTTVGDEGGFAPLIKSNHLAIELIEKACVKQNIDFSKNMFISFDFASNSFFKNKHFYLKDEQKPLTTTEFTEFLANLITEFHPFSYEDPFPEDDWQTWIDFTQKYGSTLKIIGDDLLVTNPDRLKKAIDTKACNSILIKPNQIGSVTEAIEVVCQAKQAGFTTIASHRSGETTDDFIADFAVGTGTEFVKFGAPVRGERVVKYNRLLEIENLIS